MSQSPRNNTLWTLLHHQRYCEPLFVGKEHNQEMIHRIESMWHQLPQTQPQLVCKLEGLNRKRNDIDGLCHALCRFR
jgi:hypothetical protein